MRIVQETGKPVAQVARDLGINPYTLNNWMTWPAAGQNGSGDQTTTGRALSGAEQEELARLRREKTEWPASTPGEGGVGEGTRRAGEGA